MQQWSCYRRNKVAHAKIHTSYQKEITLRKLFLKYVFANNYLNNINQLQKIIRYGKRTQCSLLVLVYNGPNFVFHSSIT